MHMQFLHFYGQTLGFNASCIQMPTSCNCYDFVNTDHMHYFNAWGRNLLHGHFIGFRIRRFRGTRSGHKGSTVTCNDLSTRARYYGVACSWYQTDLCCEITKSTVPVNYLIPSYWYFWEMAWPFGVEWGAGMGWRVRGCERKEK